MPRPPRVNRRFRPAAPTPVLSRTIITPLPCQPSRRQRVRGQRRKRPRHWRDDSRRRIALPPYQRVPPTLRARAKQTPRCLGQAFHTTVSIGRPAGVLDRQPWRLSQGHGLSSRPQQGTTLTVCSNPAVMPANVAEQRSIEPPLLAITPHLSRGLRIRHQLPCLHRFNQLNQFSKPRTINALLIHARVNRPWPGTAWRGTKASLRLG